MDSMPPATTIAASPVWMACAASATALNPEPHTWFTVRALACGGIPAWIAAWRAGFWPSPAWITQPIMHSVIWGSTAAAWVGFSAARGETSNPLRRRASRTTSAPSCGAEKDCKEPWNLPTGVRTAETMTASLIGFLLLQMRPAARRSRISTSSKIRERMRKRTPSALSSENMPPRPGTTSSVSCVCFQYSNWLLLM